MMQNINIKTSSKVIPMCYAYSTPEIKRHDGWVKIGYTEKQDVTERIKQQGNEVDVIKKEEWRGNAVFEDGSGEFFTDHDFHAYLKKINIEYNHDKKNEWFHIDGPSSKKKFNEFKESRGILKKLREDVIPYQLRDEQEQAVADTIKYKNNHSNRTEYLWNCKPRFGKTLSAYDLMMQLDCQDVLIVTNRPAIANSWYSDYVQFVGQDQYYYFVSESDALSGPGHQYVVSLKEYEKTKSRHDAGEARRIEFVSLQDLKGSVYFGGKHDKLKEIYDTDWDLLIIDEAHEGIDTLKTDMAFDNIKRTFTLHLSGTPFKTLATSKFDQDAIYNWTYADEQRRKREWSSPDKNPYEDLPQLNLYTYQMSEIVKDEIQKGISIDDEVEEYAFDLNEFFKTNDNGTFVHDSSVNKFLDALTTQKKYPFSTKELRDELKHTYWLLDRVASAKALERKLKSHPVFKDYYVVIAAGSDNYDDDLEAKKAYNQVKNAINKYDKTITLSVGKLSTGVTIPEWTAVLMLCNCQSASLYMQAAFRSQNPCMFRDNGNFYRKENAYVFDFDPARTLITYEEFANGLIKATASGNGTADDRKKNIKELLNFFPVIGEDESGEMVELDAEKVLSIPRKIKSTEVVNKGFMSNFLFQNIGNIFNAPKELLDIINQFEPVSEPKNKKKPVELPDDVKLDDDGKPVLDETVIGLDADKFGEKIFGEVEEVFENYDVVNEPTDDIYEKMKNALTNSINESLSKALEEKYDEGQLKKSDQKQIERETAATVNLEIERFHNDFDRKQNILDVEYRSVLENLGDNEKAVEEAKFDYDTKLAELQEEKKQAIEEVRDKIIKETATKAITTAETKIKEHKADTVEDQVRDHLRGFARTIPSFLMAYGDSNTTLENFDSVIPDNVFKEVTSITLDEFKMLRDGGIHTDENGNERKFPGLFDGVVFNDSIKAFLAKKDALANYFDDNATEDIFDYIPPQKTNQIYTPKKVVKMMVDMLEKENPRCFDNDSETFADLYMKSGLYIAEIVKRLYRSPKMKKLYPNEEERLKHIFEKQVYGCAPTEIIYNIAKNFILGFDKDLKIEKHNLRLFDTLPYAESGNLEQKLDDVFKK